MAKGSLKDLMAPASLQRNLWMKTGIPGVCELSRPLRHHVRNSQFDDECHDIMNPPLCKVKDCGQESADIKTYFLPEVCRTMNIN